MLSDKNSSRRESSWLQWSRCERLQNSLILDSFPFLFYFEDRGDSTLFWLFMTTSSTRSLFEWFSHSGLLSCYLVKGRLFTGWWCSDFRINTGKESGSYSTDGKLLLYISYDVPFSCVKSLWFVRSFGVSLDCPYNLNKQVYKKFDTNHMIPETTFSTCSMFLSTYYINLLLRFLFFYELSFSFSYLSLINKSTNVINWPVPIPFW